MSYLTSYTDKHYTLANQNTYHIFYRSNDLKFIKKFYNKIAKRKSPNSIVILDNKTGEIIKMK